MTTATETMTSRETYAGTDSQQYVSFFLSGEQYGIPIMKVQEIIRHTDLTRVPQASEFIEGVLNLRGRVIPVVDLRTKFCLPLKEHDKNTRIVVVEVKGKVIGMTVDGVSEVLSINADEIDPTPQLGTRVRSEYISGMGKVGDRLMILLDIDRVLSESEQSLVEEAVSAL